MGNKLDNQVPEERFDLETVGKSGHSPSLLRSSCDSSDRILSPPSTEEMQEEQEEEEKEEDKLKMDKENHDRGSTKLDSGKASNSQLWAASFLLFALLDCVLLGLLTRVSVDLASLRDASPPSSSSSSDPVVTASLEDSAFCLPCSEVYLNEIEVLQNRGQLEIERKGEWNASLCCAAPHDDLKKLIGNMFIRVNYERDRALGKIKPGVKTMVNPLSTDDDQYDVIKSHLLLGLDPEQIPTEVNGTENLTLRLVSRDAPTNVDHDNTASSPSSSSSSSSSVVFHNGVVKIVRAGHFYIHSHVPFNFSPSQSPLTPMTQYVYRVRIGGDDSLLLLENSVFPCDVSHGSCEHSFVGGVFLLQEGDEIELRVSHSSFVNGEKDFEFGVHLL